MAVDSAQSLSDWCLRRLGAPVVNVEVDDEQLTDCVEMAIQYYQEYFFDGIIRDYVKYQVTGTKITVASSVGFAVGETVTTSQGAESKIIEIDGDDITITHSTSGVQFAETQTLTNGTASSVISTVVKGTYDTGYIEIPDGVFSVIRVVPTAGILQNPDILFNVQYQIMSNEIRNITSGQANYLYTTLNYLAHLDFILKKEKTFTFHRRMNRVSFDNSWQMTVGMWYIFEVYMAVDPEVYTEVYNDLWLKKYTTALIKKQWGTNLSKYDGMSLPGGITMNGKYILEQALQEIKELEQEAIDTSAPLQMYIG